MIRLPLVPLTILAAVVAVFTLATPCRADLVVFGDSLSDTGNLYLYLTSQGAADPVFSPVLLDPYVPPPPRFPTPPYSGGRASNGPLWIERFAQGRGEPTPLPHGLGGTSFAYIGATSGPQTVSPYGVPDLGMQVQFYLASLGGAGVPADHMMVLLGGANDFVFGQTNSSVPADNMQALITTLHGAGAEEFLVVNLPRLGDTPYGAALDAQGFNDLTEQYNDLLHERVVSLRDDLGVTIYEFDLETAFADLLVDPAAYGLTNASDPALAVDLNPLSPLIGFPAFPTSLDPDVANFLFFDGIHPTATGHALIAQEALKAVPEPGSGVILLTGAAALLAAGGLGLFRRAPGTRAKAGS